MWAQEASLSVSQAVAALDHIKCRKHQKPQILDAGAHLGKDTHTDAGKVWSPFSVFLVP